MKTEKDFSLLIGDVYPMLELFKMAGDIKEFESWMQSEHAKCLDNEIFHGYKFFLECTFSEILSDLSHISSLDIEGDLLLESVGRDRMSLFKLPNTCERIVFLKNIYSYYRKIQKSKDPISFIEAYQNFYNKVIIPFNTIFEDNVRLNKKAKLPKESIHNLLLTERLYILFNQAGIEGPYAHNGTLMSRYYASENKLKICFEGYKYIVQFLWYQLLGKDEFYSSCLSKLHETTEWVGYIYENELTKEEGNDWLAHINRPYDIYKQTSFDAFFERIRDEFMYPLEEKYKVNILQMDEFYDMSIKKYSKDVFKKLFDITLATQEPLTIEEELDMALYWVPAEIIEPEFHNSIPTFITVLHGAVSLLEEKQKEFDKVIVGRFTHPLDKGIEDYDYSYGIIVDAKASAGHYTSGWLIYYDCCSNTSGSSNREHHRAEKVIKKFLDEDKVILREFTIGHEEFKQYISKYIREQSEWNDDWPKVSESDTKEKIENIRQQKRYKNIIRDSQGLLLELVSYYIVTKKFEFSKYDNISWDVNNSLGQIDIILKNSSEVYIIECKLNPNNINIDEEIDKLSEKLSEYTDVEKREFGFWFWYEPSEITKKKLMERNIDNFSLKPNQAVSAKLKEIFNFSTNF